MKRILIITALLVFTALAWAEKVATLPEIMKPSALFVDDSQLYLTEGATIYIYSLKDYKFIKKFGKEGQGPGEFANNPQLPPSIYVSTDDIIVNSLGKLSYFSKDGTFKKEIKTTSLSFLFQPMDKQFIGLGQIMEDNKMFYTVNIYDSQLNKIKEIYRVDSGLRGPGQGMEALKKALAFQSYENKIFLPGETDDAVDAFDKDMKKLYTIRVKTERRKVGDEFKKEVIHYLQTNIRTKDFYDAFLKPVRFPDYFPTIQAFFCADHLLYVMTWLRDGDKNEFHLFDMKGNFVKKLWIPLAYMTYLELFPLAVRNGKLYQVVENIDEEMWELHISSIN